MSGAHPATAYAMSRRARVLRLACGVVVAWLGVVAGVCWIADGFERSFREVGISVCPVTWTLLDAVELLRAGWGALLLLPIVGVLVLPTWIVPPCNAARRWLRLAIAQAGVVGACSFAALMLTLLSSSSLISCLCPARGCPHIPDGRLVLSLPILAVAALQVCAWRPIARRALRAPSGAPGLEVARVTFVAAIPAASVAAFVAGTLELLDAPAVGALVAPVPLAGGGTAALAAVALAVVARRRLASRERDLGLRAGASA